MKKQIGIQPSQKFTDEELIEEYNKGFSDRVIGRRLGVSKTSIQYRRYKLGLVSKIKKGVSRVSILSKNQLKKTHERLVKLHHSYDLKSPNNLENHRRSTANWKKRNPKRCLESGRKSDRKRATDPKRINYRKIYNKKYYLENPDKFNKKSR